MSFVTMSDQRFTERGAECRTTHVRGYTGPICSCGPTECNATRDESDNQQFNGTPGAAQTPEDATPTERAEASSNG